MGADFVARSGLGDELNYVPVDKHTMQSKKTTNVFAVGDAGDLPTSKAGSVAHFAVEDLHRELPRAHVEGRPMTASFDGHANCFIESGDRQGPAHRLQLRHRAAARQVPAARGRALLDLLKESRANHLGKLAFRHIYWNVLLPGRPMPTPDPHVDGRQDPVTGTTENQEK
jgi:sulfide:quinone oxidoreductase